jgi:hypothetical protein
MPNRKFLLALAFVGVLALPGVLVAQQPSARDSAIARLKPGQQIRLTTDGSGRLRGRAGVASGDTLDFAQDDAVRRIPIPAIDTLWTRGRATTTGLIVGGVVGAAFGAMAAAVGASLCESDCSDDDTGTIIAGGAIGAVLVGGVGALIGAAIPKWTKRYP